MAKRDLKDPQEVRILAMELEQRMRKQVIIPGFGSTTHIPVDDGRDLIIKAVKKSETAGEYELYVNGKMAYLFTWGAPNSMTTTRESAWKLLQEKVRKNATMLVQMFR